MGDVSIIDATPSTIGGYGFCGIKNPSHPGHARKVEWLKKRFLEGLRFKILYSEKDGPVGCIEYIPGRHAWRAVEAPDYMVIHCLVIMKKEYQGAGYGTYLLRECIRDAQHDGMLGVAVVTSPHGWMVGKEIFEENGFELVDTVSGAYDLLALRFDAAAPLPKFRKSRKTGASRYWPGLTVMYSDQCPYEAKSIDAIRDVADELGVPLKIIHLEECKDAQNTPSPVGTFVVLFDGEVIATHPLSRTRFHTILHRLVG